MESLQVGITAHSAAREPCFEVLTEVDLPATLPLGFLAETLTNGGHTYTAALLRRQHGAGYHCVFESFGSVAASSLGITWE